MQVSHGHCKPLCMHFSVWCMSVINYVHVHKSSFHRSACTLAHPCVTLFRYKPDIFCPWSRKKKHSLKVTKQPLCPSGALTGLTFTWRSMNSVLLSILQVRKHKYSNGIFFMRILFMGMTPEQSFTAKSTEKWLWLFLSFKLIFSAQNKSKYLFCR